MHSPGKQRWYILNNILQLAVWHHLCGINIYIVYTNRLDLFV